MTSTNQSQPDAKFVTEQEEQLRFNSGIGDRGTHCIRGMSGEYGWDTERAGWNCADLG